MLEINHGKCTTCGQCIETCPVNALSLAGPELPPVVNRERCVECGVCVSICPTEAIELIVNVPQPVTVAVVPAEYPNRSLQRIRGTSILERIKRMLSRPAVRRATTIGAPIVLSWLQIFLERKMDRVLNGNKGRKQGPDKQRRHRGRRQL